MRTKNIFFNSHVVSLPFVQPPPDGNNRRTECMPVRRITGKGMENTGSDQNFLEDRKPVLAILVMLLLTGLPFLLTAQPLEQLQGEMLQRNPNLRALENSYRAELERAPQVKQLPDLELGLGLFPLPVETRLGPQRLRLGATQMFPWPGVLESQKELAIAQAQVQNGQISVTRRELEYMLKVNYYRLYELDKRRLILRRNFDLLDALEKLALTQLESGRGQMADALRIRLKKEELELELERLGEQRRLPQSGINQLLNRSPEVPVQSPDTLLFATLEKTLDTSFTNDPLIRQLNLQQAVSREKIELNALERKPDLGVGLDYIFVGQRSDAAPGGNGRDIVMPRVMLKIPISANKYEAKDREEEWRVLALEDRKEAAASQFKAEIESARAEMGNARLALALAERQRETTHTIIELLETTYATQGQRFDELLRLTVALTDYDLMSLKAIVDSHLAKAKIEKYW